MADPAQELRDALHRADVSTFRLPGLDDLWVEGRLSAIQAVLEEADRGCPCVGTPEQEDCPHA